MTYEEKMLEVFARYRGQEMDHGVLERMEAECHHDVWRHLPAHIRRSWKLKLGVSETDPGRIELHPYKLSTGETTAEDLEAALQSPFPEGPLEEPKGGISSMSMGFSGDVNAPEGATPTERTSTNEHSGERNDLVHAAVSSERRDGVEASGASSRGEVSQRRDQETENTPSDARRIEAQARALGISLPPNSSLLGPFLEALAAASEYKERAEAAEHKLQQLERALRGGS